MEKIEYITKRSITGPLVILVFALIFGGMFIFLAAEATYFELGFPLVFGVIVIVFSVLFFLEGFYKHKLFFSTNGVAYLDYKNNLLKAIHNSEIKAITYHQPTGNSKTHTVEFETDHEYYTFNSEYVKNWKEILDYLYTLKIPDKTNNSYYGKSKRTLTSPQSYMFLFAGIALLLFALIYAVVVKYNIDKQNLVKRDYFFTLSSQPEYHKQKHGHYYTIETQQAAGFSMNVGSKHDEVVTSYNANDTIILQISERDYKVKICKEIQPNFWDKHYDYNTIIIYAICKYGHEYKL